MSSNLLSFSILGISTNIWKNYLLLDTLYFYILGFEVMVFLEGGIALVMREHIDTTNLKVSRNLIIALFLLEIPKCEFKDFVMSF